MTQIIDDESDYFSVDSNMWLTPGSQTQVFSLIWMNIGGRGVVTKISEVPLA